jgi:hypothetical protein
LWRGWRRKVIERVFARRDPLAGVKVTRRLAVSLPFLRRIFLALALGLSASFSRPVARAEPRALATFSLPRFATARTLPGPETAILMVTLPVLRFAFADTIFREATP